MRRGVAASLSIKGIDAVGLCRSRGSMLLLFGDALRDASR
jgi:hypothetical protein